jgi:hypothetical protein
MSQAKPATCLFHDRPMLAFISLMPWKRLLAYITGSVDRIAGALANLGHTVSDPTVANVLKRHGIPPAPERKKTTTWKEFIRTHLDVLSATDFFIHVATRRVHISGLTPYPDAAWMMQMARDVSMVDVGFSLPASTSSTIGTRSSRRRSMRRSRLWE